MRFGVHVSIAGGLLRAVDRALERGCETMQIFSSNPRSWQVDRHSDPEADIFKQKMKQVGIRPLVLHAPYLVNIGSPRFSLRLKSVLMLSETAAKAEQLDAPYVVFHLGSIRGSSRTMALQRTVESLEKVLEKMSSSVTLLLENMPGREFTLGADLMEIKEILSALGWDDRLGVCFDTCHAYVSGYDFSTDDGFYATVEAIDRSVSAERIKVVHANDSKTLTGSHRDRHQDIGQGYIGLDGFHRLLRYPPFKELSFILETPRMTLDDDLRNLKALRDLLA